MFDIGKKGSEKSPGSATSEPAAKPSASSPPAAEPVKRTAASRDLAVIGPSIRIDGDLRGEEDLLIEGEVKGTIQLKDNRLVVGSQGRVKASVHAHSVEIEGAVEGDVYGAERLIVRASANVQGNVVSPRITIEDGARFKGTIDMDQEAVNAAFGTKRASVSSLSAAGASSTDSGSNSNKS